MNQKHKKIRRYLNVIKRASLLIEGLLEEDDGLLEEMTNNPQELATQSDNEIKEEIPFVKQVDRTLERKIHVEKLLSIDCWPEAVTPSYLAEKIPTEQDQIKRADAVLHTMLTVPLEDKSFLDFGCGEGWITQQAVKKGASEAIGYDIVKHIDWNNREGANFTSEFSEIKGKKFDIIMLYDVLDHSHDPVDIMSKIKNCLNPDGHVYVRCHPWTSIHANHVYKKGLNKAFIHMFLNWDELKEIIGEDPMFTRPEKHPMKAYKWWFDEFKIVKERKLTGVVSEFFHVPAFKELLSNEQNIPMEEIDAFLESMKIQFINFHLKLK